MNENALVPKVATITQIVRETPDIKTFRVEANGSLFNYRPGQCAMLTVPRAGEAIFSITSSPTWNGFIEFSIKQVGKVTGSLHEAEPGQQIGIRGPYGNGFPLDLLEGKDLLFIGGGIGLAPLRSLISFCIDNRERYGAIEIVYGARSPQDLVFKEEIFQKWPAITGVNVHITVDQGDEAWTGHVGFVPAYLRELDFSPDGRIAITCGPPIMIKLVLQELKRMDYPAHSVITTLEMKMKCGVGKCGRCSLGSKYVCLDGPVFTLAQLMELPGEY